MKDNYVFYTAEDGTTHLAHAFSFKKAAKNFSNNWKDGVDYMKGDANRASVKVTVAMFNKAIEVTQKDLGFFLTTHERDLLTQLFNKLKDDLQDEGSLYKFVKREITTIKNMRQKAQDTAIKTGKQVYGDYQTVSKTDNKYAKRYGAK